MLDYSTRITDKDHPLLVRANRLTQELRQLANDANAEALWPEGMDLLCAVMKQIKPAAALVDSVADTIWIRFTQADIDLRPLPQPSESNGDEKDDVLT